MARPSVAEFFRQVQAETRKVSWPSMGETRQTTIMVMIMAGILALFFWGVDKTLEFGVVALLGLIEKVN